MAVPFLFIRENICAYGFDLRPDLRTFRVKPRILLYALPDVPHPLHVLLLQSIPRLLHWTQITFPVLQIPHCRRCCNPIPPVRAVPLTSFKYI